MSPTWTLKLRARHRVTNLAANITPATYTAHVAASVPLPGITRTATVMARATAGDARGILTLTVTATDRNGTEVATWTTPPEDARATHEWPALHCYNVPREATRLVVRVTGTDAPPTLDALQVTADRRTDWLPAPTTWTDVTCDVVAISSTRGGEGRGPLFEPKAGTLTITLKGDWMHLAGGTDVEWLSSPRGQQLFPPTSLSDIELNEDPRRPENTTTTLTCTDAVEVLSNTDRYGLTVPDSGQPVSETDPDGPWQYAQFQIEQLLRSSPIPLNLLVHDSNNARLRSHGSEANLAAQITMAALTTGAAWCQRRTGDLIVRNPWTFVLLRPVFSDDDVPSGDSTADLYCYCDVTIAGGTGQLVNSVTLENMGRFPDSSSSTGYRYATVKHGPFTDDASISQWGARHQTLQVSTHFTSPYRPSDVAAEVLHAAAADPAPSSVTVDAANGWPDHLDVLDPIRVRHRRRTFEAYVATVTHRVSGGRHFVTYDLARRSTPPQED